MAIALHHDFFIPRESLIHQWPTRSKVLCLLAMMFCIALVKQLVIVPWVLLVVLGLYLTSRLPLSYLFKRLPYPGMFILATVILIPLTSGHTILWQWGWLMIRQEGLFTAALIAGRFLSIITLGFILLGTTPFLDILATMRALKVPTLLTDMTLLTYRYLFEVSEQLSTMGQAMKLRGYGSHPQSLQRQWTWLSSLLGSLLLRSYNQSQRVYQAMKLRGYGQSSYVHQRSTSLSNSAKTRPLTLSVIVCSLSFLLAELYLSR